MASVEEHYKQLLAHYYSWTLGGVEPQLNAYRALFHQQVFHPDGCSVALDLGAGPGFQSIPLAELGFHVIAIDISGELLAELRRNAGGLSIVTVQDDLLNFAAHSPPQAELVVCMGDTLTHLRTLADVRRLIQNVGNQLTIGGRLCLGFRDMSVAVEDLDRFITVRSDVDRIFTCFLEYEKKHVRIHDLVYEQSGDQWVLHKSFFRKLRIPTPWLRELIENAGLDIDYLNVQEGMTTLIAIKG